MPIIQFLLGAAAGLHGVLRMGFLNQGLGLTAFHSPQEKLLT